MRKFLARLPRSRFLRPGQPAFSCEHIKIFEKERAVCDRALVNRSSKVRADGSARRFVRNPYFRNINYYGSQGYSQEVHPPYNLYDSQLAAQEQHFF